MFLTEDKLSLTMNEKWKELFKNRSSFSFVIELQKSVSKKEEKITCLYQTIYPEKSESRRGRKEKNHFVVIRQRFSIFEIF